MKEIKVSVSAEGLGESRSVNLGVKLNFKHGNHLKCQSGCVGENLDMSELVALQLYKLKEVQAEV